MDLSKFKVSRYEYCHIAIPGLDPYVSNNVPLISLEYKQHLTHESPALSQMFIFRMSKYTYFFKYQLNTEHTSLALCRLCVFQTGVKTENTVRIHLSIVIKLELSVHTFDAKVKFPSRRRTWTRVSATQPS